MVKETYISPEIRSEFIDGTSTLGVCASGGGGGWDPTAPNNAGITEPPDVLEGLTSGGACLCHPLLGF